MKKLSVLSVLTITVVLFAFTNNVNAKNPKNRLIGSWRLVTENYVGNNPSPSRKMTFTKDMNFESRRLNGAPYNWGSYSLLNDSTFVTVHEGAQNANVYHFEIIKDSLHFYGTYIQLLGENACQTGTIDEWWVKIPKK